MNSDTEYVVRDFLEMKCYLEKQEQEFLVDYLKDSGVKADSIRLHPAFSIDNCLVVIVEGAGSKRRLFYHPRDKKIVE
ncbi:MAG TPA: hypothetical protein PLL75_01380 [Candidatus Omnitrophota bacterium]|nr:hypothetical protein [Candidatus Omnitrophota bacterium]HPS36366.1 hypothetical protein [Candidatus Omnitrophota bacterium]